MSVLDIDEKIEIVDCIGKYYDVSCTDILEWELETNNPKTNIINQIKATTIDKNISPNVWPSEIRGAIILACAKYYAPIFNISLRRLYKNDPWSYSVFCKIDNKAFGGRSPIKFEIIRKYEHT